MNKISALRREGLGPPILCTPMAWAESVFASFDRCIPGWRTLFDAEAIELGLVDLFGGNDAVELDPVKLDALAELLAALQAGRPEVIVSLQGAVGKLSCEPVMQAVVAEMETLFRAGTGLPLLDPRVRCLRRDVLREFVEILEPVAMAVLKRCAETLDKREWRAAKRRPLMSQPDQAEAPAGLPGPQEVREAKEAGYRAFGSVEKIVSPGAIRALRAFLSARGTISEFEASTVQGVSPATLTRAIQVLRKIATSEIDGADPELRHTFMEGLCAAAAA